VLRLILVGHSMFRVPVNKEHGHGSQYRVNQGKQDGGEQHRPAGHVWRNPVAGEHKPVHDPGLAPHLGNYSPECIREQGQKHHEDGKPEENRVYLELITPPLHQSIKGKQDKQHPQPDH
jgi:hypothetical protein